MYIAYNPHYVQGLAGLGDNCVVVGFHTIHLLQFFSAIPKGLRRRQRSCIAWLKSFGIAPVFVTIHIVALIEKDMICKIMQSALKMVYTRCEKNTGAWMAGQSGRMERGMGRFPQIITRKGRFSSLVTGL